MTRRFCQISLSYVGILRKKRKQKRNGENDMIGFDKLNDMQKKAVLQTEGPVLILAGQAAARPVP